MLESRYHAQQSLRLLADMGLAQCDKCHRPRPKAGMCGWCESLTRNHKEE